MNTETIIDSTLPQRFRDRTFDSFRPTSTSASKALEAARELVEGNIDNLVLAGPTGVGKTHLAAAAVRAIIEAGQARFEKAEERMKAERPGWAPRYPTPPMWINVADAIASMRLEMAARLEDRFSTLALRRAGSHDGLVVLDDLGREKTSDWTGEIVYALVNARYEAELGTVVTTNLTSAELTESPYWPALSRLAEDGALVRIDAPDQRLAESSKPQAA